MADSPHSSLEDALALIRSMCWGGAVEVSQATDAWRTLEGHLGSLEEQLEALRAAIADARVMLNDDYSALQIVEQLESVSTPASRSDG
jgi:hypothetical protein